MLGRMLKMAAYAKNPVKTYAMLHPMRALKWGAAYWVVKTVLGSGSNKRQHQHMRHTAA